ncbi:helix-turn-helix transcriptional regulator [Paraburkholderia sp. J41]|uniref:AraC family transcriptional regulator n=1 Tax=Paraburkholderia sp. J41 TaxID=2805433 RepID=UPI002AC34D85|nr:helix-turn-helix transcriptional regulator [Paraburkholderia sp. J41]
MDRTGKLLSARAGVGITAGIVQHSELRFSRITVDRPALIVLRHGEKVLESTRGHWSLASGDAVALAGGQSFDVTNRLSELGRYEARWLIWDMSIIECFEHSTRDTRPLIDARVLRPMDAHFAAAFNRATEAIEDPKIPIEVAKHRQTEVLVWLSLLGIRFSSSAPSDLVTRLRRLFESSPAERWTAAAAAQQLALSEATLRRRLAAKGATFGDLLVDVRMSLAMLLLQSTDEAVTRIALNVGYDSPSRFAVRFRERFGFAPTAIRGHARR